MNTQKILENAFYDVLATEFRLGATRDMFEIWDSLHHVKLIKKLEKELNIKFSSMEAMSIRSTDELSNLVESKCHK